MPLSQTSSFIWPSPAVLRTSQLHFIHQSSTRSVTSYENSSICPCHRAGRPASSMFSHSLATTAFLIFSFLASLSGPGDRVNSLYLSLSVPCTRRHRLCLTSSKPLKSCGNSSRHSNLDNKMAKDSASSIPNPALYNPYGCMFHQMIQMISTPHWYSYQLRVCSFPDQNYPRALARKALDNRLTEVFECPR